MNIGKIFELGKKRTKEDPEVVDRKMTSEAIHNAGDVVLPPEAFGSRINRETGLVEENKSPQELADERELMDKNNI